MHGSTPRARLGLPAAAGDPSEGKPWLLNRLHRADKLLAHKPAKLKGVASVYHRHDFGAEKRKALEAWAYHVTGVAVGGNVVRLVR